MWIDDQIIQNSHAPSSCRVWVPKAFYLVLGRSNQQEKECYENRCKADHVPILKRRGGGGTVLLHPGCVVISLSLWVENYYQNDLFFRELNLAIVDVLKKSWPFLSQIKQSGISDLSWQDKKLVGSSLFRSRHFLLFQASVLVKDYGKEISYYLKHPSQEPLYRKKREHGEFISSLCSLSAKISLEEVKAELSENYEKTVLLRLKEELCQKAHSHELNDLQKRLLKYREDIL